MGPYLPKSCVYDTAAAHMITIQRAGTTLDTLVITTIVSDTVTVPWPAVSSFGISTSQTHITRKPRPSQNSGCHMLHTVLPLNVSATHYRPTTNPLPTSSYPDPDAQLAKAIPGRLSPQETRRSEPVECTPQKVPQVNVNSNQAQCHP